MGLSRSPVPEISARSAVDLMLRPLGLTAAIQYEVLLITSLEEADNMQETRVYDAWDLVDKFPNLSYGTGVAPAWVAGAAVATKPRSRFLAHAQPPPRG